MRPVLVALFIVALVAGAAWFKPARRWAPALIGVMCVQGPVCADAPASLGSAQALQRDAREFLERKGLRLQHARRMIFCTTRACASWFGLHAAQAQTTGPFGTVIGPDGWQPWIVRHELIHQVQNEQLGLYRLRPGPEWFLEGMAYAWSDDPRTLPEPWNGYRARYLAWVADVPRDRFWDRARALD